MYGGPRVSRVSTKRKRIIRKHWPILTMEPDFHGLFNQPPMFAFTRGRNMKEILTKPNKPVIQSTYRGLQPCYNCINCNNCIPGNTTNHPLKGHSIKLKVNATCNSSNVIYLLKCPCGKCYIGHTERKIRIRILEHKSNIRSPNSKTTVATHFHDNRHNVAQLKFLVLEQVKPTTNNKNTLLKRENFWIRHLSTMVPHGLNDRMEFQCYL